MARNYYSEINLHITWHTKESAPLLVPKVEAMVHHYLRGRCINTPGVFIHEIGGIETHVHLCLTIPPTLLISDFVGQLKGASSHEVNQKLSHKARMAGRLRGGQFRDARFAVGEGICTQSARATRARERRGSVGADYGTGDRSGRSSES